MGRDDVARSRPGWALALPCSLQSLLWVLAMTHVIFFLLPICFSLLVSIYEVYETMWRTAGIRLGSGLSRRRRMHGSVDMGRRNVCHLLLFLLSDRWKDRIGEQRLWRERRYGLPRHIVLTDERLS